MSVSFASLALCFQAEFSVLHHVSLPFPLITMQEIMTFDDSIHNLASNFCWVWLWHPAFMFFFPQSLDHNQFQGSASRLNNFHLHYLHLLERVTEGHNHPKHFCSHCQCKFVQSVRGQKVFSIRWKLKFRCVRGSGSPCKRTYCWPEGTFDKPSHLSRRRSISFWWPTSGLIFLCPLWKRQSQGKPCPYLPEDI